MPGTEEIAFRGISLRDMGRLAPVVPMLVLSTLIEINVHRATAIYQKIPILAALQEDDAMDVEEAISGRRSVREYTAQPVDERRIRRLIDDAVRAPSAVNQQPWTFTVVRDHGVLDRISRDAKAHMLATMPPNSHSDHFRSLLNDPDFHIFYHAPVLILISALAQGPWIIEDCALAAQNLMLAAHAAGLGSCWIGFAQSFLNTSDGKKALDLPAAWVPIAPIIVGHPRGALPPVQRREPEVRWVG